MNKEFNLSEKYWSIFLETDKHRQDVYRAEDIKEFVNLIAKRFNDLADNLPEESNHNFNRNSILGKIKNEVLIMKKIAGDKLK